jgi:hypothetical protein
MKQVVLSVALFAAACCAAQESPEFRAPASATPPAGTIRFTFDNPQLQPAHYEITIHADGTGHFISRVGSAPPDDIANLPAQGQERDIQLTDAARDRLFATAAREKYFAVKCDAGGAKIAFQGTKNLAYDGPDGHGSCAYNYTQDAKLQWVTTELTGLAATLEEGRRLTVQHEHARLVIDAELETLTTMVKDGQATEVQNIAPILGVIIADENVMLRARRRAQALMDANPPAGH